MLSKFCMGWIGWRRARRWRRGPVSGGGRRQVAAGLARKLLVAVGALALLLVVGVAGVTAYLNLRVAPQLEARIEAALARAGDGGGPAPPGPDEAGSGGVPGGGGSVPGRVRFEEVSFPFPNRVALQGVVYAPPGPGMGAFRAESVLVHLRVGEVLRLLSRGGPAPRDPAGWLRALREVTLDRPRWEGARPEALASLGPAPGTGGEAGAGAGAASGEAAGAAGTGSGPAGTARGPRGPSGPSGAGGTASGAGGRSFVERLDAPVVVNVRGGRVEPLGGGSEGGEPLRVEGTFQLGPAGAIRADLVLRAAGGTRVRVVAEPSRGSGGGGTAGAGTGWLARIEAAPLSLRDLAGFYPGAGPYRPEGELRGTLTARFGGGQAGLEGELAGEKVKWVVPVAGGTAHGYEVDRVALSTAGGPQDGRLPLQVQLVRGAARVNADGHVGPGGTLDLAVSADKLAIPRDLPWLAGLAVEGEADFRGRLTGTLADPRLAGSFESQGARIRKARVEQAGGRLTLDRSGIDLKGVELRKGRGVYRAEGRLAFGEKGGPRLNVEARATSLGDLGEVLGASLETVGSFDGTAQVGGSWERVTVKGKLGAGTGELYDRPVSWKAVELDGVYRSGGEGKGATPVFEGGLAAEGLAIAGVPYRAGQAQVRYAGGRLDLKDVWLSGPEGGEIRLSLHLEGMEGGGPTTVGVEAQVKKEDLLRVMRLFGLEFPVELNIVGGRVDGDLVLGGPVDTPSGRLALQVNPPPALGLPSGARIQAAIVEGRIELENFETIQPGGGPAG